MINVSQALREGLIDQEAAQKTLIGNQIKSQLQRGKLIYSSDNEYFELGRGYKLISKYDCVSSMN